MTEEQEHIINCPATDRVLVTAEAGTGKTSVLIARAARLITEEHLSPGAGIGILTFSRAAARVIRARAAAAGGDIRYLRVSTFDSFATRLLAEFDPTGPWLTQDYDPRIRSAIELIQNNSGASDRVRGYAHILVDEVQDLVGDRADFVKALLGTVSGGFTFLGDPAQGIYNFTLKGPARAEGAAALYRWIRQKFASQLREFTLTRNFRAQTPSAKLALWAGPLLNAEAPDYRSIKSRLEDVLLQLPTIGRLVDNACDCLRANSKRTAILCQTNGQALMVSRQLHDANVAHVLQRRATERVVPPWIGVVVNGFELAQMRQADFTSAAAERLNGSFDRDAAWQQLQRMCGSRAATINVRRLAERIRTGNVPDDLVDMSESLLVVSTIHRAKGLEFDRVIIAVPDGEFGLHDDAELLPEDTRLLYVALTRPRCELQHLELPKFNGLYEKQDRWIRQFGWKVVDVECRGSDVHKDDPAGAFIAKSDPQKTQHYLAKTVKAGDPIILSKALATVEGAPRVFYSVEHDSQIIGVTSEEFGAALWRSLSINRNWVVRWPEKIENLRIESIDTVAGSEAAGVRAGLGRSGLWLRARISGLGTLQFARNENA